MMHPEKCYACKYRASIPGDAHSQCKHPDLPFVGNHFEGIVNMFAEKISDAIHETSEKLNLRANYHGIKNGWFKWPYNFDPVWLENCDGFEEREEK